MQKKYQYQDTQKQNPKHHTDVMRRLRRFLY